MVNTVYTYSDRVAHSNFCVVKVLKLQQRIIHRRGPFKMHKECDSEAEVSVVVIGRNEGERLIECLKSLASQSSCIAYVDSGSTDSSCDAARQLGAHVVNLDMSRSFTAARARNAGLEKVLELKPNTEVVMFVDGDCLIADGFLVAGAERLKRDDKLAIVIGRLRERYPDATIYNRLCDSEWIKPIGKITECGGNALIRVNALKDVGGYREDLIAGEEPEMCIRMASRGWTMECIDSKMGLHDARMTKFSQWWKRSIRCGHAYAEGATLHGKGPSRHNVKQCEVSCFGALWCQLHRCRACCW